MTASIEADVLLIDHGPYLSASTRTDPAASWLRERVPEHEDRDDGHEGTFRLPHSAATDDLLDRMDAAGFTFDSAWGG